MMDELTFYNQQFNKYKKYDRNRATKKGLNLENAEDYFEYLVKSYSSLEGTLVDLGCGDGYFTSTLARLNAFVIGVEPSSLIFACNEQLERENKLNLTFLKEDAYHLSLDDNSVDLVISRRGPDPENEIFRVLKKGGIFIFITIGEKDAFSLKHIVGRGQHFRATEKVTDKLTKKFNRIGFSEVHCKEFLYDDIFHSVEKLKEFLHQVPIFDDFSASDYKFINEYCKEFNTASIHLNRHRVVLFAKKS